MDVLEFGSQTAAVDALNFLVPCGLRSFCSQRAPSDPCDRDELSSRGWEAAFVTVNVGSWRCYRSGTTMEVSNATITIY